MGKTGQCNWETTSQSLLKFFWDTTQDILTTLLFGYTHIFNMPVFKSILQTFGLTCSYLTFPPSYLTAKHVSVTQETSCSVCVLCVDEGGIVCTHMPVCVQGTVDFLAQKQGRPLNLCFKNSAVLCRRLEIFWVRDMGQDELLQLTQSRKSTIEGGFVIVRLSEGPYKRVGMLSQVRKLFLSYFFYGKSLHKMWVWIQ